MGEALGNESHARGLHVEGLRPSIPWARIVGRRPSPSRPRRRDCRSMPVDLLGEGLRLLGGGRGIAGRGDHPASQGRHLCEPGASPSRLPGFPRGPEPRGFFPMGAGQEAESLPFRMKRAPPLPGGARFGVHGVGRCVEPSGTCPGAATLSPTGVHRETHRPDARSPTPFSLSRGGDAESRARDGESHVGDARCEPRRPRTDVRRSVTHTPRRMRARRGARSTASRAHTPCPRTSAAGCPRSRAGRRAPCARPVPDDADGRVASAVALGLVASRRRVRPGAMVEGAGVHLHGRAPSGDDRLHGGLARGLRRRV